eukprot:s705_g8.t1
MDGTGLAWIRVDRPRRNISGTALVAASSAGHLEVVNALLAAAADVDKVCIRGTALSSAAAAGHYDIDLESAWDPAEAAASGGHFEIARMLRHDSLMEELGFIYTTSC